VRRAKCSDAATIARALRIAFAEFEHLYTPAAFAATCPGSEEIEQRIREGPVWIALRDEGIIGTVSADARGRTLYIRGMAVVPGARGLGWAGVLLDQIECYARAAGFPMLELRTTPFLTTAIALYERAGFRRTDTGPPDHCGTPTFTMTKNLENRAMPTTKSHFSLVAETAPPEPEIAHQHFISKLELETDPSDVHFDMERGANGFVVVDARSVEAYARRHIPGAINLPSRSINAESAAVLPKDKVVVTYCWGPGCNASTKAAARLSKLGFRVKELIGGIEYWEKEGYAVEGTQPPDERLHG